MVLANAEPRRLLSIDFEWHSTNVYQGKKQKKNCNFFILNLN